MFANCFAIPFHNAKKLHTAPLNGYTRLFIYQYLLPGLSIVKSEADLGFFRSRGHNGATIYREGPSLPFKSLETLTITA